MNSGIRRRITALFALSAAGMLALSGCGTTTPAETHQQSDPAQSDDPIAVVASVNQWGSLAELIGGDDVEVTSILSSTAVDAHDFEPATADIAALQAAQIVVSNGAGYDAWATKNLGDNTVSVSAASTVGATEEDNPHLWFSKDARDAVATELASEFGKLLPDKKDDFKQRLKDWKDRESELADAMNAFSEAHPDATYAATEAVAYYLLNDMGFEDATPQGYAQSTASESEPAPADLQDFQALVESHGIDVLINNTQSASDATNMITGTAGKSDVPVFDISEQMPEDAKDLTDWITTLVESISALFDESSTDPAPAPANTGSTTDSTE